MNIVVLAGGISAEREVSLSSGSLVCTALRKCGHHAVLVDSFFGLDTLPEQISDVFLNEDAIACVEVRETAPDLKQVKASRKDAGFGDLGKCVIDVCRAADIVYMGLHGEDGENGRLQSVFDVMGIKYTGAGYLGSALAMNKWIAKQILAHHGIRTPRGSSFLKGQEMTGAEAMGFPCIVKPCSGGSSLGIAVANSKQELEVALADAFRYEDEVLVEEFIRGREFSVGILGDMTLPPIEIIPKGGFYDYAHKYQAGWTEEVCPADISRQESEMMQKLTYDAYRALKLDVYARGEFILASDGAMVCLEMNTLPGMTPTSLLPQEALAVGISYEQLCEKVIELSLEKYRD